MSKYVLRELERHDVPIINRWRADAALVGNLGSAFRYVGSAVDEKWFDNYLASRANNVRLAISSEDGVLIGAVYLLGIDWVHRHAEFSIWIGDASVQRRGAGETATRGMLNHAFGDLNLERVWLTVLPHNEPAIRLYRKVGFREEGRQRSAVYKNGRYEDMMMMSVLRSEYPPPGVPAG
ncbi:MAG: GNAT family protein [Pseudomonadota bacterium]|nr:GNAT family protein [Pseudomonadota bacterium]